MRFRRVTPGERRGDPSSFASGDDNSVEVKSKRGQRCHANGIGFRSIWEAQYARHLEDLKCRGLVADWEYEVDTFLFNGVAFAPYTYTPDFKVTGTDGEVVYHEVKGWMDPLSKLRLKRMAKFYPEVALLIVDAAVFPFQTAAGESSE